MMAPFFPAHITPEEHLRTLNETLADYRRRPEWYRSGGVHCAADVASLVRRSHEEATLYGNGEYTVAVYEVPAVVALWPAMLHLSIKRNDREPLHDWRVLQEIKNAIVGPEHEAVELYPAESRLVDSANQCHLWVLADAGTRFPFGFTARLVTDDAGVGRAKQRPRA